MLLQPPTRALDRSEGRKSPPLHTTTTPEHRVCSLRQIPCFFYVCFFYPHKDKAASHCVSQGHSSQAPARSPGDRRSPWGNKYQLTPRMGRDVAVKDPNRGRFDLFLLLHDPTKLPDPKSGRLDALWPHPPQRGGWGERPAPLEGNH